MRVSGSLATVQGSPGMGVVVVVDLLCSAVARRWIRKGLADECTGRGVGDWSGSTVGNCCRFLSAGVRLLIASNPVVAWEPK